MMLLHKRTRLLIFFHLLFLSCSLLNHCGFRLQEPVILNSHLHELFLKLEDPYSDFARILTANLTAAHIHLVTQPSTQSITLEVIHNIQTQESLSTNGIQPLNQQQINATIIFSLKKETGLSLFGPEKIEETRFVTVHSNQILGDSNEIDLLSQQMQHRLVQRLISRLASKEIIHILTTQPPQSLAVTHSHSELTRPIQNR